MTDSKVQILIVDDMHPCIFDFFPESRFNVIYQTDLSYNEALKALKNIDILILRSRFKIDEYLLTAAPNLKVVARVGSGTDNIDVRACERKSIAVVNAPEGNSKSVAEHTLGLILCLLNKIAWSDAKIRSGIWPRKESRGLEIGGKTIGIIGFGNTGSAFGNLLENFGCECLAYDKREVVNNYPWVNIVSLDELMYKADILSLHIPLDENNFHWIGDTFIKSMRKPFYLVNTSRGEVVDMNAVKIAFQSGKIKGMALDVLPNENFASFTPEEFFLFEWLISQENVILTPHVAGWSEESYERLSMIIGQKVHDTIINKYK